DVLEGQEDRGTSPIRKNDIGEAQIEPPFTAELWKHLALLHFADFAFDLGARGNAHASIHSVNVLHHGCGKAVADFRGLAGERSIKRGLDLGALGDVAALRNFGDIGRMQYGPTWRGGLVGLRDL